MLNHKRDNTNKNQIKPKVIRERISEWEKYTKAEEKILKITAILLKQKIISFDDIEQLEHSQDRNLLNENKFITSSILCDMFYLFGDDPEKDILDKANYYQDHFVGISDKELRLFKEQHLASWLATSHTKEDNPLLIKNKNFVYLSFRSLELRKRNLIAYFAEQKNKDDYRKSVIKQYKLNITHIKQSIDKRTLSILSPKKADEKKYKGQATYHNLFNGIRKEQSGTVLELINKEKEEERKLLLNLIINDNDLTEVQKQEAFNNITNGEDFYYEIDRWLGKKLTKQERRILRVLRRIIYQMIEQEEITGIGKSIYEAEIPLSRIYEEYGLEDRECGGYQHNQTKIIQDVLFGFSTRGLHEDILFKHTTIMKTRFILQIEKIQQRIIGIERTTAIRIAMPHFLFVSDKKASSYYYQDTEGFKKFMAIKGMAQSEAAFNIVEYLEWLLSSKLKERSLNLSTLIEEGGVELGKRWKTHKAEVLETIKTILNNMKNVGYLVKGWRLEKGKFGQDQYTFENLRYELLMAGKNKCEVTKLPRKKEAKK